LQVHFVTLLLPTGESEFIGQLSQLAFPRPALYVPMPQLVHNSPSGPVEPALQVQAVMVMLPAGESEFAGQLWQLAFPLFALYVPATHCVHNPPFAPEKPVLQIHPSTAELPVGEVEWVGHAEHEALPVAEYVPIGQLVHCVDRTSSPRAMASATKVAAVVSMYVSTMNRPAMLPLK